MRQQSEIIANLNEIRNKHLEVCIFGCGNLGKGVGYDILKFFGININYYSDNDSKLWGDVIKDDIKCIPPKDLSYKNNVACFVMVGVRFHKDIIKQLLKYNVRFVITSTELYSLDVILDNFIKVCLEKSQVNIENNNFLMKESMFKTPVNNRNQKKYAVYTCITGNYDQVSEPEIFLSQCDYFLISDEKPFDLKVYQWIDINKIIPIWIKDNRRKNRFCKINAPYIFSEYEYSIYMDGNVQIVGDVIKYVNKIEKSGIAAFALEGGLYEHALATVNAKVENNNIVFQQISDYFKEGMPRRYGMFNCTILVRNNTNLTCKKVMLDWWNEVFNRSSRDQISFTYCLWKNNLKCKDVGVLGRDLLENDDFKLTSRHHYLNMKWMG